MKFKSLMLFVIAILLSPVWAKNSQIKKFKEITDTTTVLKDGTATCFASGE